MIISPNKTLQGMYAVQVWPEEPPSRRAMHAAVCEAGWGSEEWMPRHRHVVAGEYRGQGRAVLSGDWTFTPHDRGPQSYGTEKSYDDVEKRTRLFQVVMTAVISHRQRLDGLAVVVQEPDVQEEELAYLQATVQESYAQMEAAQQRLRELLDHLPHRQAYKKRTE